MAFNPKFDRPAKGKFSESNNIEAIRFGSASYVTEDDLNEAQSISRNKTALINRAYRTSGIINPIITNDPSAAMKISAPNFLNVDGHIIEVKEDLTLTGTNTILQIMFSNSIDTNLGMDARVGIEVSKRIYAIISVTGTPKGTPVDNDDNLYKLEDTTNSSPTGYIYYLRVRKDGYPIYSSLKNGYVKNIKYDRSINQPTITFGRVNKPSGSGKTTKVGWSGRNNMELSDSNEGIANFGILSEYLWNPDHEDYYGIGKGKGEIVTWKDVGIIDGLENIGGGGGESAVELDPGFRLSSDTGSDVKIKSVNPVEGKLFNGNGTYTINLKLSDTSVTKTTGNLIQPGSDTEFYTKITVDEKGRITSGKKATSLEELGIKDFVGLGAANNLDLLRYDSQSKQWKPVSNSIANCDQKFKYNTTNPTATDRLNYNGYFYATKIFNAVYNDYAEYFEKGQRDLEPGDVLEVNDNGLYVKSSSSLSNKVVGVYSDTYGHLLGGKGNGLDEENFVPVGLAGRVYVKVTGTVKPGDLLVSSDIIGVAKAENTNIPGTVIGKALQSHSGDKVDRILMLIMNR